MELVHRDVWLANEAIPRGQLLNASTASNVIVFQTGGPECQDFRSCAQLMREMQASFRQSHLSQSHTQKVTDKNQPAVQIAANVSTGVDIAFNFLFAGNQTFEARGWSHRQAAFSEPRFSLKSASTSSNVLAVAFVGDFGQSAPAELMLRQADALLAIAVQSGRLVADYRTYGGVDGFGVGRLLFEVLAERWPTSWESVIDV